MNIIIVKGLVFYIKDIKVSFLSICWGIGHESYVDNLFWQVSDLIIYSTSICCKNKFHSFLYYSLLLIIFYICLPFYTPSRTKTNKLRLKMHSQYNTVKNSGLNYLIKYIVLSEDDLLCLRTKIFESRSREARTKIIINIS